MIASHLLYLSATGKALPACAGSPCLLCGTHHSDGSPVEAVIRDTFSNHGMCRARDSLSVCPACAHVFNHRWECGQKYESEYRKHSLLVTPAGWTSWQRAAMRTDLEQLLRDGTQAPTLLVVALSKKKHLVPLPGCRVTPAGQRTLFVQLEEESLTVTPEAYASVRRPFDELLALGCRKGEILDGNYHPLTLRKTDVVEVLRRDRFLTRWRPSGLLTLVSYITLLEDAADGGE